MAYKEKNVTTKETEVETKETEVETKETEVETNDSFEKILNESIEAEDIEATHKIDNEIFDTLYNLMEHRKLNGIEALAEYIENLECEIINLNKTIGVFRNALKNKYNKSKE